MSASLIFLAELQEALLCPSGDSLCFQSQKSQVLLLMPLAFIWLELKIKFKKERDEQNLTFKALRWPSMGQEEANYQSILQGSSHLLFEMAVKRPRCQAENTLPSSFTFYVCSSCSCVGSIKYTSQLFTRLQHVPMHTEVFSFISVALDKAWALCLCIFETDAFCFKITLFLLILLSVVYLFTQKYKNTFTWYCSVLSC